MSGGSEYCAKMHKARRQELIELAIELMQENIDFDEEKLEESTPEMIGIDRQVRKNVQARKLAIEILEKEAGK